MLHSQWSPGEVVTEFTYRGWSWISRLCVGGMISSGMGSGVTGKIIFPRSGGIKFLTQHDKNIGIYPGNV